MKVAVILVSGGMDSCVTVASAIAHGYKPAFLHINYGQRTESRELMAFSEIAHYYQVDQKLVVNISHLVDIGASCLTDENIEVPNADLESDDIPISYVPFRNANILAASTSWAEVLGAEAIYVGAVEEDSSGYPDCRRSFFDAFEQSIDAGTKPGTQIKIITPLINLSKKEIVEKGIALNAPIYLTWSCYKNEDVPCGECDSCALRARGFEQAGVRDPILS
ncbi:MAG: 7-cyano-7-deazaguanine synthase QueC [Candidatus Marinimicrobia bacterium]|nr:7-cyano-7-deazaguanine synthase QueC [Candidatus Neomarinimicrobiota bacterium]